MCTYENLKCEDCRGWVRQQYQLTSYCNARARTRQAHDVNNTADSQKVTHYSLHTECNLRRLTNDPNNAYNKPLCWHSHKGQLCSRTHDRGNRCSRNPRYDPNA